MPLCRMAHINLRKSDLSCCLPPGCSWQPASPWRLPEHKREADNWHLISGCPAEVLQQALVGQEFSGEEEEELLERLEVESGTVVEDAGYTMQVTEAASDGKSVYAVVTVTAPEGEPLEGERYVLEAGVPWIMTDRKGSGYPCFGGGGINEMGRPAQNKVSFLLDWDFQGNLKGKKLVLEISRIVEENEGGQRVLADGNWTLVMDVPKSRTKSRLQWTRVETEGDVYYVYRVEVTPLGIHIHAVKWPGGETGATKDSFLNLPVTIGYQDGSRGNGSGEAAGSGGLFCEKTVHYDGNRLMDPEKIREVWLGETGLKLD